MAILRGTARLLLDEHARRPFSGSVLELGKMLIFFTAAELRVWAREHGVTLRRGESELSHDARLAAQGCLSDRDFFGSLGFDEIVSTDISSYEGADTLFDLNGELPPDLTDRFDVVFDGGTLQHIFDLRTALTNMHLALKVGGRIIIGLGASHNHVDHGFYMFSPTLFHDYFSANGYRLEAEYFFEFDNYWVDGRLFTSPWRIYRYEPGCLDDLSYGGLGRRQVGLFVVATKTAESTGGVAPLQSYFGRSWSRLSRERRARPPARTGGRSLPHHTAKRLWTRLRRWRVHRSLRVVARY